MTAVRVEDHAVEDTRGCSAQRNWTPRAPQGGGIPQRMGFRARGGMVRVECRDWLSRDRMDMAPAHEPYH